MALDASRHQQFVACRRILVPLMKNAALESNVQNTTSGHTRPPINPFVNVWTFMKTPPSDLSEPTHPPISPLAELGPCDDRTTYTALETPVQMH
jgi:hypothetical protein